MKSKCGSTTQKQWPINKRKGKPIKKSDSRFGQFLVKLKARSVMDKLDEAREQACEDIN